MTIDIPHYAFNHPKNYLGYAVALAHTRKPESADRLTEKYVVGDASTARRGAEHLDLVSDGELTERGEWATSELRHRLVGDENCLEVLELFDDLRGTRKRFVEQFPSLRDVGPGIAIGDPSIARLVNCLREIHKERQGEDTQYAVSTIRLFFGLHIRDTEFATELLLHDHPEIREADSGDDVDALQAGSLNGVTTYRSATTYQLHNLLWHLGVVWTKGVQAKDLNPFDDTWALEVDILDTIEMHASADVDQPEVA